MTHLTLIPIGTSPAWYNPGEPTSGYLVEADGRRLLVDCGSGVIASYLEQRGTDTPLDAIIISHVHADHCLDLVPLAYGLRLGSLRSWPRPQLWLPPGAHERLQRLVSAWDGPSTFFEEAFDVREYDPTSAIHVADMRVVAHPVPHYIECWALRISRGDTSIGYTADLGPCAQIAPFMRGVDLLLAEATLTPDDARDTDRAEGANARGHITAREAGAIASACDAGALVLTHLPLENGRARAIAAAASAFSGPVDIARPGIAHVVSPARPASPPRPPREPATVRCAAEDSW